MKQGLREYYHDRLAFHERSLRLLGRRGRILVWAQLLAFLLAVSCVVAFTAGAGHRFWLVLAVLWAAAYGVARWQDVRNSRRMQTAGRLCSVYRKELRVLDDDYSGFDSGERYVNPRHEYTFDMDIFGGGSLYHRICRCVTTGGADRLARCLGGCALSSGPYDGLPEKTAQSLKARREAILELAWNEPWRAEFMACGQDRTIDTHSVMQALEKMRAADLPRWPLSPLSLMVAWVGCIGFFLTVALSVFTSVSVRVPVWWGLVQFALVYGLSMGPLKKMSKGVSRLHRQMKSYVGLMRVTARCGAQTAGNRRLADMLGRQEGGALGSLEELERIIDGLDRRGNVLCLFLFDMALLSDYFLMRRFLRWQHRYMDDVARWIEAVSEMDARVSLATFCYNHPEAREPEVVDCGKVVFEAEGLVHPFLGEKGVPNDFRIDDGHYYIITGANMAGKSTFLRSLGVNYILAMAGMPVFAHRLRVSLFALFSSMRTSDDLSHGISYFNAELLRLRQLTDCCKRGGHTLIILDEILKGTNSLDKLNGSRMFLEAISTLPVTGVIATHDLELSKMVDSHPGRFHNYCFEIGLSDKITYTYKITEGVARNQNATYLLRNIIKDIQKE